MNPDRLRILLVGGPGTVESFRATVLRFDSGDNLQHVAPADASAVDDTPDVVVLDAGSLPGIGRAVRDWRTRAGITPFVIVLARDDDGPDADEASRSGAEAILRWPDDSGRCGDRLRLLLRLRRAENASRATGNRARFLEHRIAADTDSFLSALEHLIEAARPGASARAALASDLCLRLAHRFAMPDRFTDDLTRAARVIELGHVAESTSDPAAGAVRRAQTAEMILRRVSDLGPVAALLGSMAEHWDGTGGPHHLLSGQIPLRSRILGLVEALIAGTGAAPQGDIAATLDRLRRLSGTVYDPMVFTHLEALLHGVGDERVGGVGPVLVPVSDLREGMVLAEDLYTDSGFKLLPRGARLASQSLNAIWRRHQVEPLHAAVVERTSM